MRKITIFQKLLVLILALILTALAVTGCAPKEQPAGTTAPTTAPETQGTMPEDPDQAVIHNQIGLGRLEEYDYPNMGLHAVLTEPLLEKLEDGSVVMLPAEKYLSDDGLGYGMLRLLEATVALDSSASNMTEWSQGLKELGAIGVYHTSVLPELDQITGCTDHREIGKSGDGSYVCYLSLAEGADEALLRELEQAQVTFGEMKPMDAYMGVTAFSQPRVDTDSVGKFQTTDIHGKEYTEALFADYDLTLVNVFTTWCTYCVEEMPELEKLKQTMADRGVNVVSVVYDGVNEKGEPLPDILELAARLEERAGVSFPMLLPDSTNMNGRLQGIGVFPESFFVDKNGNLVGGPIMGAKDYEGWLELVETTLEGLK